MIDLIKLYGQSINESEEIFEFIYHKGISVLVSYENNPGLDKPKMIKILLNEGYAIDTGCFSTGFRPESIVEKEKTPEQQFAESLNKVILASLDGFAQTDTISFGRYGFGFIDHNRFVLEIAKTNSETSAQKSVEDFSEFLNRLKINCCALMTELPDAASVVYGNEQSDAKSLIVIYTGSGIDTRIMQVKITVKYFPGDTEGYYETYMMVYLQE
ncbi:MAG TPA: hypothetical protein P5338_00085 [Bacteroidales bacterium]|nr:hypothetical protein [Bacteroidales bacterium]